MTNKDRKDYFHEFMLTPLGDDVVFPAAEYAMDFPGCGREAKFMAYGFVSAWNLLNRRLEEAEAKNAEHVRVFRNLYHSCHDIDSLNGLDDSSLTIVEAFAELKERKYD